VHIKGYPLFNRQQELGSGYKVKVTVFAASPMYKGHKRTPEFQFDLPLVPHCATDNFIHDLRKAGWSVYTRVFKYNRRVKSCQ